MDWPTTRDLSSLFASRARCCNEWAYSTRISLPRRPNHFGDIAGINTWRMPSWRELPSIHRDDMPCELERSAIVRLLDIAILWGDAKTAAWCSRRCELRPFSFAPIWKPKNIDVPGPRKVEPEKTKEDGERDAMPGMLCCMTWMG